MVQVNAYKTLIIPVEKQRNQTLTPDDFIELALEKYDVTDGQETKQIVTSVGDTHVLSGIRKPLNIDVFVAKMVPFVTKRKLDALIGEAIAIRDFRYPTYGGILSEVKPAPTVGFPNFYERLTLMIALDSTYPAIVPSNRLRRQVVDIVELGTT